LTITKGTDFISPIEDSIRRRQLRRLDDILVTLEELNLREDGKIPKILREKMTSERIPLTDSSTISDLIEMVFRNQEPFMLQDRRKTQRRRLPYYELSEPNLALSISKKFRRFNHR
jgi:hypothetical protein